MLKDVSGKESVVYKCVAESDPGGFDGWLNKAIDTFGVNAYNLVGGASSANQYSGPTIPDVAAKLNKRPQCAHGGVTIAERHVKKGNEHETLVRKGELGMRWFISQAIYDPEPMIKLLKEYGALCKQKKIAPKRIVLTFAPCGREKTMRFIKWLGVTVPEDVEKEILEADDKVGKSVDLLCAMCRKILDETKGCGVPLGISVESVSIFKNEINAAHELFRRTQSMLLDFLGEPWLVQYKLVSKGAKRTSFDYGSRKPAYPRPRLSRRSRSPRRRRREASGVAVCLRICRRRSGRSSARSASSAPSSGSSSVRCSAAVRPSPWRRPPSPRRRRAVGASEWSEPRRRESLGGRRKIGEKSPCTSAY